MDVIADLQGKASWKIGATGMESIVQNIQAILLTLRFSIPLMRGFAHDGKMIDSPAPLVAARLAGDLIDAIEKYEPRVKVRKVEFLPSETMEGRLMPRVTFSLEKGVEA